MLTSYQNLSVCQLLLLRETDLFSKPYLTGLDPIFWTSCYFLGRVTPYDVAATDGFGLLPVLRASRSLGEVDLKNGRYSTTLCSFVKHLFGILLKTFQRTP